MSRTSPVSRLGVWTLIAPHKVPVYGHVAGSCYEYGLNYVAIKRDESVADGTTVASASGCTRPTAVTRHASLVTPKGSFRDWGVPTTFALWMILRSAASRSLANQTERRAPCSSNGAERESLEVGTFFTERRASGVGA
jgi:hypothetical protein